MVQVFVLERYVAGEVSTELTTITSTTYFSSGTCFLPLRQRYLSFTSPSLLRPPEAYEIVQA